jgi:hypothetical protein
VRLYNEEEIDEMLNVNNQFIEEDSSENKDYNMFENPLEKIQEEIEHSIIQNEDSNAKSKTTFVLSNYKVGKDKLKNLSNMAFNPFGSINKNVFGIKR